MTTSEDRTRVGIAGLGSIGSAIAAALLTTGHDVALYNRSPGRAAGLGGRRTTTMGELAGGAELLIVAVTDAAAATDLLGAAGGALAGTTVATFTTSTPAETRRLAALVDSAGGTLLDVGVQTAPADIGTPAATFVASGARAAFERHRAVLDRLGTVSWLGEQPDAAAAWDLALFGLWYDAQLGLLRAFDLARAAGLDPVELAATAAGQVQHVVAAAADTAAEMRARSYPAGPAPLSEHAPLLERLVAQRADHRLGTGGLERIAHLAAAASRSSDGLTAITDPPA